MSKKNQNGGAPVKRMPFTKVIRKHWLLLLMLLPATLYVIIFSYIPMTGIVMAFELSRPVHREKARHDYEKYASLQHRVYFLRNAV